MLPISRCTVHKQYNFFPEQNTWDDEGKCHPGFSTLSRHSSFLKRSSISGQGLLNYAIVIVQHFIPGAAQATFGLCFSAAVILAPKCMEKDLFYSDLIVLPDILY